MAGQGGTGDSGKWKPRTRAVHAGTRRSQYGEMSEAIFLTQGFLYDSAEDAEARFSKPAPTSSSMPATATRPWRCSRTASPRWKAPRTPLPRPRDGGGQRCADVDAARGRSCGVVARAVRLVPLHPRGGAARFGVEVSFVDGTDIDQWRAAIRPGTKAVFFETVSNPTLELIDIAAVADLAHAAGALVVADNVFATPVYSRALELGADVVVYSATKHIDGQGRCLGGVICGTREFIRKTVEPYMKHTGGAMSPFNAWVMLKGLETLDLRVRAQSAGALAIARALEGDARLSRVLYPHLPDIRSTRWRAPRWKRAAPCCRSRSKGGQDCCLPHAQRAADLPHHQQPWRRQEPVHASRHHHPSAPARRQKAELGITPGLVRLSVGLEDPERPDRRPARRARYDLNLGALRIWVGLEPAHAYLSSRGPGPQPVRERQP
jgi:O-succinylhomoserine sulfhydrylase